MGVDKQTFYIIRRHIPSHPINLSQKPPFIRGKNNIGLINFRTKKINQTNMLNLYEVKF